MIKLLSKLKTHRKLLLPIITFCVFGVFGFVKYSYALSIEGFTEGAILTLVGWVAQIAVWVIGAINGVVIWGVVHVAQYNNFTNEASIIEAWTIIRDLCNMFFILILLVIAFATILRVESYNIKKNLPKLLLMAVLINFSRTICGLIIDAGQIVMLTFINALGSSGGNYIEHLGVQKYLTMVENKKWEGGNLLSSVGGLVLGVIFLITATVVMLVLLLVLVIRIVMLWIYVVLSPLAFLLSAFPQGQKYASQWWGEFTKYVITGPVLAFFLWLALISGSAISGVVGKYEGDKTNICFGPGEIMCPDEFINFVVAIGMLIGGLIITSQLGGAAGKVASRGMDWAKKANVWTAKQVGGLAKEGGKLGLVGAKTADSLVLKGRGAEALQKVKHAGGAKTGAVTGATIGMAVGGPLGAAVVGGLGALGGGLAGKYIGKNINDRRKRSDAIFKIGSDGKHEDPISKVRSMKADDGNFYKIKTDTDGVDKFVGKDNELHTKEDFDKLENKDSVGINTGVKEMGETKSTFWAHYSESKGKGWAAKDAAEDEKISKLQSDYSHMSDEMLGKLLDIEKDTAKRMAIALTMSTKQAFNDHDKVNTAKEALGGNGLLLKKFNEEMNKRNMVLNNTRKDGTIDEGGIAKLVSSGKAKWEDQNIKTMNQDSLRIMARQTGVDFHKKLESMLKTKNDRDKFKEVVKEYKDKDGKVTKVEDLEFGAEDIELRKSYGAISKDFLGAFSHYVKDDKGNIAKEKTVNREALTFSLSQISKAEVYSNIDENQITDPDFEKPFQDAMKKDIGMLVKIARSNDMGPDMIKKYMDVAKKDSDLLEKMKKDKTLSNYVDGSSGGNKDTSKDLKDAQGPDVVGT